MKGLVALFFAALLGTTFSQTELPEGCIDPPGNGALADILVNAIETARPLFETGIPSLGIPPLDPFGPVPRVSFHINTEGLRMDGDVNNTMVRNLAQFFICSLNISVGVTQKFAFEFRLDNFHMDGQYDVDGMIASLLPVFGSGDYRLDTYKTGFSGAAKVSYNPLTDHASIKGLNFDVFFETLNLELECILGCGDMSDLINEVANEIGPALFEAVWAVIEPTLAAALQAGINDVLADINISDIIGGGGGGKKNPLDLGNANAFVDLLMETLSVAIVSAGLDPAPLPDAHLNFGLGVAEMYKGQVIGLSKMHRSGTCTLDKVASWVFLYANLAVDNLQIQYHANVTSGISTSLATVSGSVEIVDVYMVARQDVFGLVTDIDQFVITEFGRIDLNIEGLGVLGFLLEPLTEAVMNLVREDIANLLENDIKELLQNILGETPWPVY